MCNVRCELIPVAQPPEHRVLHAARVSRTTDPGDGISGISQTLAQAREPGGSGGACPSNFWTGGAPPLQLWTVNVVHFYFCLFLHVNLGPSQIILGEIRGMFRFE